MFKMPNLKLYKIELRVIRRETDTFATAEFYIPPKEISFRLKNKSTNKVLFSREKKPNFGQFEGDAFADQWWHLVPGTGKYDGWYLVKSDFTGKVLFSRTKKSPHVDHIDGDGKWADQWFKIESGTGDRENWFRIKNTSSNTVVDSADDVGNSSADGDKSDDQYWCFEFEDIKFVGVDYKVDEHKILSNKPEAIGSETVTNEDTDSDQSTTITIAQTKTTTTIHEHTHGLGVKGSFSWRFGSPAVTGENNVTIEVSQNNEWKIGENVDDTKTFTVTAPVVAKPRSKVTATVTATKSEIEVPYTMTWKSAKTGYEFKTQGTYKGTNYWNVHTVLKRDTMYDPNEEDENRDLDEDEDSQEEEVEAEVHVESAGDSAKGEEQSLDDENLQESEERDEGYREDENYTQNDGYEPEGRCNDAVGEEAEQEVEEEAEPEIEEEVEQEGDEEAEQVEEEAEEAEEDVEEEVEQEGEDEASQQYGQYGEDESGEADDSTREDGYDQERRGSEWN